MVVEVQAVFGCTVVVEVQATVGRQKEELGFGLCSQVRWR